METPPELARGRYDLVAATIRAIIEQVQAIWRTLTPDTVEDALQDEAGAMIAAAVLAGQLNVADSAAAYIAAQMTAQGASPLPDATLVSAAFAGLSPGGGPLESLLYLPAIGVQRRIAAGLDPEEAMVGGLADMSMYTATAIADAARTADQVGMATTRSCVAYMRVVQLPACSRCIVLAGQMYPHSEGFLRHPNCFPAGVSVSGPSARAATRRRYEGELTVITTAGGQELPATGNHPILTDRGWVPANLIQEGDHVVRGTLAQGAVPLVVPHERQVPSLIEDVWRPDGMRPLLQVPTTAEDFHGDGGHGDVDVVLADGLLRNRGEAAFGEPLGELGLGVGVVAAALLASEGAPLELVQRTLRAADSVVGGLGLGGPLLLRHPGRPGQAGLGGPPALDAGFCQHSFDGPSTHVQSLGDRVLALAGQVGGDDVLRGECEPSAPRWDAPGLQRTAEDRRAYAERGMDLLRRLSGQVELDRVVEVRRVDFSGHVYNLTSAEGWYRANGLIVSNCDCQTLPLAEKDWPDVPTPEQLFAQLTAKQQAKVFTVDGARAIRAGADLGQVVNARRGMDTVHIYRRTLQVTHEGATRRSVYGRSRARAGDPTRRFAGQRFGQATSARYYRSDRSPRLMPEEIFRLADGVRSEELRLLRRYGYIV